MATAETSFGAPPSQTKDWRKFVTLDPVSHISFKPTPGDRPQASIKLINKGDVPIMFKIKTTKPMRFLVRPSQGVIGQKNEVEVQVLFTQELDSPDEEDAIASDKFLVQLTPAPHALAQGALQGRDLMQQLIQAWTTVDKKDKYEFRLRVAKRKDAAGGQVTPTSRGTAPEQIVVGTMEGPSAGSGNEAQLMKEVEKLKQEYQALQEEKIKANARLSSLQKLEDSKSFAANKSNSSGVGGASSSSSSGKNGDGGIATFHVMLIALISLIVGALIARSVIQGEATAGDADL